MWEDSVSMSVEMLFRWWWLGNMTFQQYVSKAENFNRVFNSVGRSRQFKRKSDNFQ